MRHVVSNSTYAVVVSLMTSMAVAETVERSFEAAAGGRFVLDADWGHVEVETWDQETVDVVVEHADKLELEFERHDDAVTVRAERKGRRIARWFAKEDSPRFHVTVPRRFDLDLVTAGGNIHIADLDGEAAARTSGGKLKIDNVSGPIVGRTSGGSIHVESAGGPVKARRSGGIHPHRLRCRRGGCKNVGRLDPHRQRTGPHDRPHVRRFHRTREHRRQHRRTNVRRFHRGDSLAGQPDGESSLRTVGGSITVGLAQGVALDIDARTTGGRVSAELANMESTKTDRSTLVTAVNGGGPTMTLRTTGGSIRLRNP